MSCNLLFALFLLVIFEYVCEELIFCELLNFFLTYLRIICLEINDMFVSNNREFSFDDYILLPVQNSFFSLLLNMPFLATHTFYQCSKTQTKIFHILLE